MKIAKNRDLNANKNRLRTHPSLRHAQRIAVALGAAVLLALAQLGSAQCLHCNTDSFAPNKPLNDLGQGEYIAGDGSHNQGGLYPSGFNQRPSAYNTEGIDITTDPNGIVPRNKDTGQPDPNGKIVMISIGMCNTTKEFGGALGVDVHQGFRWRVMNDDFANLWRNPPLVVVDCAQSGKDAAKWASANPQGDEDNNPWKELNRRLQNAPMGQLSRKQVQIVWLKEALIDPALFPYGPWPAHVNALQGFLETILHDLASPDYFGNVKMVFLSPRTRAWTTNPTNDPNFTHNPEPYAYETGFADKWLIQERIEGHSGWPWLSWGPYLWTDGMNKRSDGLRWLCTDVKGDCVHPVDSGVTKVSDQLLAFFKTDPVARPWFLRPTDTGPTITEATATPSSGTVPKKVQFHAAAIPNNGNDGFIQEYVWTFDDGCYAYGTDPLKWFNAPSDPATGPYKVHLTVIDNDGNAAFRDIGVTMNAAP
jgi:hypothetical protein